MSVEDVQVGRGGQAQFADMDGVVASVDEQGGEPQRKVLVDEQLHAGVWNWW